MNIVLLGHDDIASLYAMSRLVAARPEHAYTTYLSGELAGTAAVPPGLAMLAAADRALCEAWRAVGEVPPPVADATVLAAPNTPEGLAQLGSANPDVIVSIRYRRILHGRAVALPRLGVINLHSGILPDYQGVMATFWAMLNDAASLGCTLHRIVDAGIDTGPVLAIASLPTDRGASYLRNVLGLYPAGVRLVVEALDGLATGVAPPANAQKTGEGRYYSTPDATALARFEERGLRLVDGSEVDWLASPAG